MLLAPPMVFVPMVAAPPPPLTNAMLHGRPAFTARLLAFLIDGFIVAAVVGVAWQFVGIGGPSGALLGWWMPAILMAVYMIALESRGGQTLGKRLCDVKVVKEDLTPAGVPEAQTRALSILLYPLVVPMFLDLYSVSEDGQTMGDKWAHTIVMKAK